MNKAIEIIDGVAYAVIRARDCFPCAKCAFYGAAHHSPCSKYRGGRYYRRLTADERVAVQEALVRGLE